MNIEKLKLVNGDEIISEVMDREDNKIDLRKPAKIEMTIEGIALIPWDMFSKEEEEEFAIEPSHVILRTTPVTELLNAYNEQFGSGIQIIEENPGGGIIL